MDVGTDFKGPVSELVRVTVKFLHPVPGRGTSVAVERSAGAASLAAWVSRSIALSRSRRRSSGVSRGGVGIGPLLEVIEDAFHDGGVLDAGDHLDGAAALFAGLDVDLEYPFEALRWHLRLRGIPIRAFRISYVGEQGCELYVPFSYGLSLWDLLHEEGVTPVGIETYANSRRRSDAP